MNKKLEEMTIEEIKVILCDQLLLRDQILNNIAILQQELVKREKK